jgi:hypothetical protein
VSGEAGNWLLWAALVGLGGWRLASLLVAEEGPFAVFARARNAVLPAPGEEYGFVAKVLDCVWCCSVFTTTGVALAWLVHPAFAAVPAAWAIAILAERVARP